MDLKCKTPADVLKAAKDHKVKMVDVKFIDMPGMWQHFSVPPHELELSSFTDGFGFDGSSIRGYQNIDQSDMLVVPDANTAMLDPFTAVPTLSLICNIVDPITKKRYGKDPRYIVHKAEEYVKKEGFGDTVYFGPEAEFFIFDNIRYDSGVNFSFFEIDSVEGNWNTGTEEEPSNLGHKPRPKEGYFPTPPVDSLQDVRTEMVNVMEDCGVIVECHHHEVSTAGQAEIDMKFQPIAKMADQMMLYKYIVKNVAKNYGMTATFMPKPLWNDNGSGMHCHSSLWKGGNPLFAGNEHLRLSQTALYYIGGILKHSPSLLALTNPTTNSFKRLVPGFEAPVNLVYSARNRSAACRIPVYSDNPKARRVEYRCPDPACNPYLAFTAILMAGLDGIKNKIDPGKPTEGDLYSMTERQLSRIKTIPGSLEDVLNILEKDHKYLLEGGVFTKEVIDTWIAYKRETEVDEIRQRPHPHEFFLYYDI